MNEERKAKKRAIQNIRTIDEYNAFVSNLKITDEQKEIMHMIFVKGYDYRLIGDKFGYSERTVKAKVRKILDKI